ncbi:MAG: LamG-like jellyroll fold domain-containing protein [Bacteroidota bacterium]
MRSILISAFLFLSVNFQALAQVNLTDGLVAFYPFDGNANDESGNGLTATIIDSPVLIAGCDNTPGSAFYFDGVDDYIEVASTMSLNLSSSAEFAVSVWIKAPQAQAPSSGTVSDIISKWSSANLANPYSYTVRINNQNHESPGAIVVARYDGTCANISKIESTQSLNDDEWHNLIFQKESDDFLKLYIDGQLEGATEDLVNCSVNNAENLLFGLRSRSNPNSIHPYRGGIDDIRLYNRALTADEIDAIADKSITHVQEWSLDRKVIIYPNPPLNNEIHVKGVAPEDILCMELFDLSGRLVTLIRANQIPSVAPGVYVLKLTFKDTRVHTDKIVIN